MNITDRIALIWPEADPKDVMIVGPLGSRPYDNELLYWRSKDRISTGMIGTAKACFEGSMLEFEAKVKMTYSARAAHGPFNDSSRDTDLRRWSEYNLAIRFLKDLPKRD